MAEVDIENWKPDLGKIVATTKTRAAIKQLKAAVGHFYKDEYECAITLASAAEGILPFTNEPHLFLSLKDTSRKVGDDLNYFNNWLKHPGGPEKYWIPEFFAVFAILRAISKLLAIYSVPSVSDFEETRELGAFVAMAIEKGYVPPENKPSPPTISS